MGSDPSVKNVTLFFFNEGFPYNNTISDIIILYPDTQEWWDNEHIPYNMAFDNATFNQMIFAAEETTATTTTYANVQWKGPFCTVEPSTNMMPATMRIFDFYLMRGDHIFYNWMMIDTVDLMLQAGTRALPKVKKAK